MTEKTTTRAETASDKPRNEIYYTQIVVITAMIVFATGFLAAARVWFLQPERRHGYPF